MTEVERLFQSEIHDLGIEKYAVFLNNKLWSTDGKFIFDSKEQANKAFYNSMRWQIIRAYQQDVNPNNSNWWENPLPDTQLHLYKKFKADYEFRIGKIVLNYEEVPMWR